MKYYKGIIKNVDEPRYGGKYVVEHGEGGEVYNFTPFDTEDGEICFGFFETKSTNRVSSNQLHIEKIEGVSKDDDYAENVLVVWCAKLYDSRSVIVGWYKNATVYRDYEEIEVDRVDGSSFTHYFNIEAAADNCVLLPEEERITKNWWAPRRQYTRVFGFGQANVWFASEPKASGYISKVQKQIMNYDVENWLREYPEVKTD